MDGLHKDGQREDHYDLAQVVLGQFYIVNTIFG